MKMNKSAFLLKPFSNTTPFPIAPRNLDVPLMRLKNWTALGKFICTCGLCRLHFLGRKIAKGEKVANCTNHVSELLQHKCRLVHKING